MFARPADKPKPRTKRGTGPQAKATKERLRDRNRKRREAAEQSAVLIPQLTTEDRAERERREADDELWVRSYWSALSWEEYYPLSAQQRQMLADFRSALEHGGDRAVAASRGEGKTTLACAMLLKEILRGKIKFAIMFAANASLAGRMLDKVRNPLANSLELRRYYPEVCVPIAALEGRNQRAKSQLVSGYRHDTGEPYAMHESEFHWAGSDLQWPDVPGSPSAGAIVIAQGLDSAVRGVSVDNRRPDVCVIDDPDTVKTQTNPEQARKLLDNIDSGIAALGSQKSPITRIALMTIKTQASVAAQLTDRTRYPNWRGRRDRFLVTPPARQDLWAEFVELCKTGWTQEANDTEGQPIPLVAHQFYLDRQSEMDAGGEVSNVERYNHRPRPEGGTVEASALEFYYGQIARIGRENVSTEYDNEPPVQQASLGLTPTAVLQTRSGCDHRIVPANTKLLTIGGDVKKVELHWVAIAWDEMLVGSIVDLGRWDFGTAGRKPETCETLILEGLQGYWEWVRRGPWHDADGEVWDPDFFVIDSGWKADGWNSQPVDLFCDWAGRTTIASKGIPNYRRPVQTDRIAIGDNLHMDYRTPRRLLHVNADHFKLRVQEAFTVPFGVPGSIGMYSPRMDDRGRDKFNSEEQTYAKQICAEEWDAAKGKFKPNPPPNHYLDATALARAAAIVGGLSVNPKPTPKPKPRPQPQRPLEQSQGRPYLASNR